MKFFVRDLKALEACTLERIRFRNLFPRGAEINTENLRKAYDAGLNIRWLHAGLSGYARGLCSPSAKCSFCDRKRASVAFKRLKELKSAFSRVWKNSRVLRDSTRW